MDNFKLEVIKNDKELYEKYNRMISIILNLSKLEMDIYQLENKIDELEFDEDDSVYNEADKIRKEELWHLNVRYDLIQEEYNEAFGNLLSQSSKINGEDISQFLLENPTLEKIEKYLLDKCF